MEIEKLSCKYEKEIRKLEKEIEWLKAKHVQEKAEIKRMFENTLHDLNYLHQMQMSTRGLQTKPSMPEEQARMPHLHIVR